MGADLIQPLSHKFVLYVLLQYTGPAAVLVINIGESQHYVQR